MIQELTISKADPEDIEQLRDISAQTFYETFAIHNTKPDMDKYLAENLSSTQLLSELKDPASAFYFIKHDNKVIGYLKLRQANIGVKEAGMEIERIYVLTDFQGTGAGNQLMAFARETALQASKKYIWLGVWEKNEKAIRFYLKQGFIKTGSHIFKLGNDEQTDFIMESELQ